MYEDEGTWRQQLPTEMEEVCRETLQQGFHPTHVVPVQSAKDLARRWTEGGGFYFATNQGLCAAMPEIDGG